jgi:Adenylate and Guanylate cyclase catalytic domain/SAM domain (Sterile alpha motif)
MQLGSENQCSRDQDQVACHSFLPLIADISKDRTVPGLTLVQTTGLSNAKLYVKHCGKTAPDAVHPTHSACQSFAGKPHQKAGALRLELAPSLLRSGDTPEVRTRDPLSSAYPWAGEQPATEKSSTTLDKGKTQGDHSRNPGVAGMDIGELLKGLDLERYEAAFRDNEIDFRDVPNLTKEDLEELGLPLGPRRRLLKAIEALQSGDSAAQKIKPPAPPQPFSEARDAAERRQLTVMFCDLVGSTALSSKMDPEDLREVISAYQAAATQVIQTYDGLLAKFMGDGILAYYGFPRAHEDDAERAVRAGLDIIRAVSGLKTRSPEPLQVRIGIATGLVVVGRGSRTWRRWRDSQSCRPSPIPCYPQQPRHQSHHTTNLSRPVRVSGPRPHRGQRLQRSCPSVSSPKGPSINNSVNSFFGEDFFDVVKSCSSNRREKSGGSG